MMALNSNQQAKFNNQDEFMYQLGFVDGVREIGIDYRIFPVSYTAIPGIEDRIVEDYNELPNPSTVPEGEYWIVTQQRQRDTYTGASIVNVSPADPTPGDGNVVYSKDAEGKVTLIVNTTKSITNVQDFFVNSEDKTVDVDDDDINERYITFYDDTLIFSPTEVEIYYSTAESEHKNGMYEVISGEWVLYTDASIFSNLIPTDFKETHSGLPDADIFNKWLLDKGFMLNTSTMYTYDSGIKKYSVVTKDRSYAMLITWGNFLIEEGFYTPAELKAMSREEIVDAVTEKLIPLTNTYTIEGEEATIPRYLDILEQYMFVRGKSSVALFLNQESTVGELRHNFLSFNPDGSLDEANCEFQKMLIFTGLEKNVYDMENNLQDIIVADDSQRQVMQDIWDNIEMFKDQTDEMYINAQIQEESVYTGSQIFNGSPDPISETYPSHEGYEVVYVDGSVLTTPAPKYIYVKTYYQIKDYDIANVTTLDITCDDDTVMGLGDISPSNITIIPDPYSTTNMIRITVDVSDPWPSGNDWYPKEVIVDYYVNYSLTGWDADNSPPPVFVKDASNPTRLGYRFLRNYEIYVPGNFEQYPTVPEDPEDPSYYLNQYPYDTKINKWIITTDDYNDEFISEVKTYFDVQSISSAITSEYSLWSCDEPLDLDNKISIIEVDSGTKTFTVAGDEASTYPISTTLVVVGSTGNDGTYTVASSLYDPIADDTNVIVNEAVPDTTADGYLVLYYDTVQDFLDAIDEKLTTDELNTMFEDAKEVREKPKDTKEYVNNTEQDTKRPSGTRAQIIGLCDAFDGVYVVNRNDWLSQKAQADRVLNFYGN